MIISKDVSFSFPFYPISLLSITSQMFKENSLLVNTISLKG